MATMGFWYNTLTGQGFSGSKPSGYGWVEADPRTGQPLGETTERSITGGTSGYSGGSIVDYLKSVGQASDFASRTILAQQYGIANYSGTAEQNTRLLNMLRGGIAPAQEGAYNPPEEGGPSVPGEADRLNALLEALQAQLDQMVARGESINPNIEITPERAAEFLLRAESEIDPYYQTELKMAREGFLSSMGYTKDQIQELYEKLSREFTKGYRELGESMAEKGFALSGIRKREERELAEEKQLAAEQARTQMSYQMGQMGRDVASLWGGGTAQPINIREMPTFTPTGEVTQGIGEMPMFDLGTTAAGLAGSRQYEWRAATRTRQAELEEAERQKLYNEELRKLTV